MKNMEQIGIVLLVKISHPLSATSLKTIFFSMKDILPFYCTKSDDQ